MAARKKAALPVHADTNPKPRIRRARKAAQPDAGNAPATLALSESERLKVRTYLAEYRRYNAEATLRLMEKHALLRQLDPDNKLGLLDQAIRGASESAAKAQAQHNETLAEVEKRLGISIKDFSFDEETGRLWPHNAAPTKE